MVVSRTKSANKDNMQKDVASKDDWINDFKNPPMNYRPVPFWSWNESMEPEIIRYQMNLMAKAGIGGCFVHSRIGLTTPYMSEQWFIAVDAAVKEARQLGQNIWLYDEDKWPSGFSGGAVPLADESFRMKVLVARPVNTVLSDTAQIRPVGKPIAGVQVYIWTASLGHDWFNGACYTDMMNRSAIRCFIDHAYEPYYEHYKKDYGQLICAEFTDEPCTIFRGRLPAGAVPYTDELLNCFHKMHGYYPVEKLYLLFIEQYEAQRFRLDYFRTVNYLFENNFSKQIGQWCSDHKIDLTGHYMCEHGLYEQQAWGVKIMPNYRHQAIPGIDHLGRQIKERITAKQCHSVVNQFGKKRMLTELYGCSGGSMSFEDRLWIASQQICLGANLLNPHLSLYTMAGCRKRDFPPNLFYQQPWWPVNNEIDMPLARLCVAMSQGCYHAEALIVHPQESVLMLWQSKCQVSDSSLIGRNGTWDFEPTADGVKDAIGKLDAQVKAITDTLLNTQHTFDFGDETILASDGEVAIIDSVPHLRVGQMDYPVVILPGLATIAASTMELLNKFQNAGGVVIHCGHKPEFLDGCYSDKLTKWIESVSEVQLSDLPAKVRNSVNQAVELIDCEEANSKTLWCHVRKLEDGKRLVFLTNLHRLREFITKICFAGKWQSVFLLNMWNGKKQQLNCQINDSGLQVEMKFSPAQSYLLLLSTEQCNGEDKKSQILGWPVQSVEIPASAMEIKRLDDNAITLDYARWQENDGQWSSKPMPIIAIQQRLNHLKYNGPLKLRYTVRVKRLSSTKKVHLVAEYPERYVITVNGQIFEYEKLPFWRDIRWLPIDITGMLSEGENVIEMYCENFQHGDAASIKDQKARYGTEIESIYLVGDFSVIGTSTGDKPVSSQWNDFGLPPIDVQCFCEDSFYLTNSQPLLPGDTTVQGLPFYPGRLQLKMWLPDLNKDGNYRIYLNIDNLDGAVADVAVDNRKIGSFVSHPYKIDLTKIRGREITITLYGTLRNLLGPHHHINGELPMVGPEYFAPTFKEKDDVAKNILRWMDGQSKPDWLDRYCMVSFGKVGRVTIESYN